MSEKLVADVMTSPVTSLDPNDKLVTAADIMSLGRVRHLPVVDEDGDLVGIVTQRDLFQNALLKALGYGAHGTQKLQAMFLVKEAMSTSVMTTSPTTPLREAAEIMLTRKIGCLPVLEGGELVGILTEADFVALVARPA